MIDPPDWGTRFVNLLRRPGNDAPFKGLRDVHERDNMEITVTDMSSERENETRVSLHDSIEARQNFRQAFSITMKSPTNRR